MTGVQTCALPICFPVTIQRLRLRGNTTFTKQGILTLNPIWAGHWIKKTYFDEPKRGVTLHHSTYRDNRFLQEDVIRYMQSITDSYYKDVYVDGNWGVYGGVVFSDYIIEDLDYSLDSYENLFMGMDYHPSSVPSNLDRLIKSLINPYHKLQE